MLLTAVVTKDELVRLVESITPLTITIDARRSRSITLGRPSLELVDGRGLRFRGDARIAWDVAGVNIPVTLQAWQLLLVPRLIPRNRSKVLAFEPIVEELDLKLVPSLFDDKIANAIRGAVAENRDRIAWDFARSLSKRWPLSAKICPPKFFELAVADGDIAITPNEVRLAVRLEACFAEQRAPAQPLQASPHARA
jgi:hypothetical protein